ncbi:depupylase/deamidase Dop [Devriesea agamarum]|uniref:depupylase/deamidase Dop n=1 Tax=Devriesea agamarum TaxID=472569 RepID=UPI00071D654A|nr:depupylase/deamidase Dop [Devriesea agamarum]
MNTVLRLNTQRVMGIETEFGVLYRDPHRRAQAGASSAIELSHRVVAAYALLVEKCGGRELRSRIRWDYGDENPLRDARGFDISRAAAHPSQLTHDVHDAHVPSIDLDQPLPDDPVPPAGASDADVLDWAVRHAIGNAVLTNGARLYVDHAHPEYSSPEVLSARDGVIWDRAGEHIARSIMERLSTAAGVDAIALYKNNTDGKGASYGTHENYLVDRSVPFEQLTSMLIPFLATRQVMVGSGRVGLGTRGLQPGFQISSRADFFEAEVGLETTLNRPIVNTRDEPHADASRWRRLHVIIGDANTFETATFLKLGATSLVLAAIEAEQATGRTLLPRIDLLDPVEAVHVISHDLSLSAMLPLRHGGSMTALDIQRAYLNAVEAHADLSDQETAAVLTLWREILDGLANDPSSVSDIVEWVAKRDILLAYRQRGGLDWDDARLQAIDLQFGDLDPARGIAAKLRSSGRVRHIVEDRDVEAAVTTPPSSTRAYLRGQLITHHRDSVLSAGWDCITVTMPAHSSLSPEDPHPTAMRLQLADPCAGSAAWCAQRGINPQDPLEKVVSACSGAAEPGPSPVAENL